LTVDGLRVIFGREQATIKTVKIVLIGAGSREFSRLMMHDIVLDEALNREFEVEVVLVDINEKNLAFMLDYAKRCASYADSSVEFSATTDRKAALPGADFVLVCVAVKRMELWEQDFRVPLSFGIRHIYGENGGPGAIFHALRNLKIIMPICEDIERFCPDAYVFNFTNPEARILTAILRLTTLKAYGLCHGFYGGREQIARILERPVEELDVRSAGMNHFYHCYHASDRKTGEDLWPEIEKRLAADSSMLQAVPKYLWDKFGVIGMGSSDHEGEYVAFAQEFFTPRWMFGIEHWKVPTSGGPITSYDRYNSWANAMWDIEEYMKSDARHRRDDYLTGRKPLDDMFVRYSGELAIPIICDLLLDRKEWRPAVNTLNTEGYIENLSPDACIEAPATVDSDGVHPEHVGSLPEGFAAQIRLQHSIQKLLVQGFAEKSRSLALQALLLDPVVDSADRAEKMFDCMLELQSDYLPELR